MTPRKLIFCDVRIKVNARHGVLYAATGLHWKPIRNGCFLWASVCTWCDMSVFLCAWNWWIYDEIDSNYCFHVVCGWYCVGANHLLAANNHQLRIGGHIMMTSHEHHRVSNNPQLDCLLNSWLSQQEQENQCKAGHHWSFVNENTVDSLHKGTLIR